MNLSEVNGTIAGYDPGGNNGHGIAVAKLTNGKCVSIKNLTLHNAEEVIRALEQEKDLIALGIDTLVAWSSGPSGWRAADLWLRQKYREVLPSIVSPNGLFGSMGLNGMTVIKAIKDQRPEIQITETHPKVLYWALTSSKYQYAANAVEMDLFLSSQLGCSVHTCNDHEWDAAFSILPALKGYCGIWKNNLFDLPECIDSRLVYPCGPTYYWWPS